MARRLAGIVALAVCLGCGGCDWPPRPIDQSGGPIRLIDELGDARIDSPLQGLEPWETVREGLEDRTYWRPELKAGRGLSPTCKGTRDTRFRCEAEGGRRVAVAFKVPVRAHSQYRIEAKVRRSVNNCGIMRAADLRESKRIRFTGPVDEWVPISLPWQTGRAEDTLRISFRGLCSMRVDSLEVRELILGEGAELSAMAAQAVSPFADRGLGMAKFGSLLPREEAEETVEPFDENWAFRETILAPAPTDVTYRVKVPRGGRLRFSYALSEMSRSGDHARFEVLVGRHRWWRRVLWSEELTLTPANWHWHEAVIDLAAFAGQTVHLTLRTRASGERGYALWGTPAIERPRRSGEPPNIVLIAVDTLRADRLSGYGYEKPTSPHLDALARDGALFLYPVSQSTQTPPSFASLFTGLLVSRHDFLFATSRLAPNVPTLARVLRQNGWTTHATIFHAALYDHSLARGFERYFSVPRKKHRADQNLRKGLDWLEANGDRRFFYFLHFSDPHQPFTQPQEFVREATASALAGYGVELPFNVSGSIGECAPCRSEDGLPAGFRELVNDLYDEEVNYVDDQIGLFLQALRERDLYDDTIIAFVSDHGETLWDHFDYFDHGGINQHDELTRVPLIIKPAKGGGYVSNAVVDKQVSSFDLMPTLLEMAGIDTSPLTMDARSLVPLLREDASTAEAQEAWAVSSNEQAASLRGRGWKWTITGLYVEGVEKPEGLFELANDPGEKVNVAARHPGILRAMRSRYMETLLDSVGGSYLLVLLDPEAAEGGFYRVKVQLTDSAPWRAKPIDSIGLWPLGSPEQGTWLYRGRCLLDGLALFARLPPSGGPTVVEITRQGGGAVSTETAELERVRFEEGVVGSLLEAGIPGVYLIEAPLRSSGTAGDEVSELDTAQEEALRALGYIQ